MLADMASIEASPATVAYTPTWPRVETGAAASIAVSNPSSGITTPGLRPTAIPAADPRTPAIPAASNSFPTARPLARARPIAARSSTWREILTAAALTRGRPAAAATSWTTAAATARRSGRRTTPATSASTVTTPTSTASATVALRELDEIVRRFRWCRLLRDCWSHQDQYARRAR